jgi:hypothetical protein
MFHPQRKRMCFQIFVSWFFVCGRDQKVHMVSHTQQNNNPWVRKPFALI